jgi:WD repeat-containing protein 19
LVRVLIDHLRDIQSAVAVVRRTHSKDSAKLVVKFFQEQKEYKPVIEFCLLAGLEEDAFEIAQVILFLLINIAIRIHGVLC